jgi:[acyl-carrier-protein] S-malonyltransferase
MKLAWLFPGQGTQEVGMGRAVTESSAAARDVFRRADEASASVGGPVVSKLCFEGPKADLTLTANTQPAVVATSVAVLAALLERYPLGSHPALAPAFAAGHSLGEWSALVAAGALSLEDAVRLVRLRGSAMQEAVPPGEGAMAAIMGLDEPKVRAVCDDASAHGVVAPANFNAPGQIVIAGSVGAVQRASELVGARGGKAIPLAVSAPFHCPLMRPAAVRLQEALSAVSVKPLAFPVVSNVEGVPNSDAARVPELLVRQVDGPVEWVKCVESMVAAGVTHALELGPGKVLAGLVKRIHKPLQVLSVSDPAGIEAVKGFVGA